LFHYFDHQILSVCNNVIEMDCSFGLWSLSGLWQLYPPILSLQSSLLQQQQQQQQQQQEKRTTNENTSQLPYSAVMMEICREWGLDHNTAKFSLELLYELVLKEREKSSVVSFDNITNEYVIRSLKQLMPQLQNPTLLLSLLFESNNVQLKRYIEESVQNFIRTLSAQRSDSRDLHQRYFQLYTPLNLSLLPTLNAYNSLLTSQSTTLISNSKETITKFHSDLT
jgi:hypothetical protein